MMANLGKWGDEFVVHEFYRCDETFWRMELLNLFVEKVQTCYFWAISLMGGRCHHRPLRMGSRVIEHLMTEKHCERCSKIWVWVFLSKKKPNQQTSSYNCFVNVFFELKQRFLNPKNLAKVSRVKKIQIFILFCCLFENTLLNLQKKKKTLKSGFSTKKKWWDC